MSARMVPCERCARHVRSADARCPFCDAPAAGRAAAVALVGVALAVSACAGPPAPVYGGPPQPVRTVAPSETATSPEPPASAPPTPTVSAPPPDNRNVPAYGMPRPRPTPAPDGTPPGSR